MIIHKIRTRSKSKLGMPFARLKLLVSIALAAVATIYPNFIKDILGSDSAVGYFYSFLAVLGLITVVGSTVVFEKYSRAKVMSFLLGAVVAIYVVLTFISNFVQLISIEVFRVVSVVLIGLAISLFVRDFSAREELGKNEGELFLFENIGYFIGPLVAGILAYQFGYDAVFIMAAVFSLGAYIYFSHQYQARKNKYAVNNKKPHSVLANFKDFFANIENMKSYMIKLGIEYWWATFYFYVPLYIINSGYDDSIVGLVLSLSIVPLIFLEVPVGKHSDKKGYKSLIFIGFIALALILALMSFTIVPIYVIILLLLTSFAVSLVEPLQDVHFFKSTQKKDEDRFYGLLMTSLPIAHILAPFVGALILTSFGSAGIWLASSGIALFSSLIALTLNHTR